MTPFDATTKQLTQTLGQYNPVTNAVMEKISMAMIPLGMAIIGILFMVELMNLSEKFDREDGGMTSEVLMNVAMKYIVAFVFVSCSGLIIDAVMWFGIQMTKWIDSIITITVSKVDIPTVGKAPWWQKPLLGMAEALTYIFYIASQVVVQILVFMRALQLYIVKAIAPILIAFFVSTELRSIAIGFFKHVMALALQGALLILILGLIPILTANDFLSFASFTSNLLGNVSAAMTNLLSYVELIFKFITIIFLLIGSQNMSKRFMGGG